MKDFKPIFCLLALSLAAPLFQGCAYVVGTTALAGGTYAGISYASNGLQTTKNITLEKAWTASNEALKELNYPVTYLKKDKKSAKLKATTPEKDTVVISLSAKSDTETEITVSVGNFDTDANREAEQRIYNKMRARF